jgi:hypothetical protein
MNQPIEDRYLEFRRRPEFKDILCEPAANRVKLTLLMWAKDNTMRTYSVNCRASEEGEARIKLLELPEAWLVQPVSVEFAEE